MSWADFSQKFSRRQTKWRQRVFFRVARSVAVQRVWHHNWGEGGVVWPGAVLEASREYCLFRHGLSIAADQSDFLICALIFFFFFQTFWVNVVFKSAIESSRFASGICSQLYAVELCFFYAFLKTLSWQIKINELEHNLQEQRQRIEQLECKKVSWKTGAISGKRSQTPEGGVTSHRDMSAKEESCCSRYLGNGTVNSGDAPSSTPSRENAFYFWSRGHSRPFLLQPAVSKMFSSFLKTCHIKMVFCNLGFCLAFV